MLAVKRFWHLYHARKVDWKYGQNNKGFITFKKQTKIKNDNNKKQISKQTNNQTLKAILDF